MMHTSKQKSPFKSYIEIGLKLTIWIIVILKQKSLATQSLVGVMLMIKMSVLNFDLIKTSFFSLSTCQLFDYTLKTNTLFANVRPRGLYRAKSKRLVPKQCKGHHGFYIDCHCYIV